MVWRAGVVWFAIIAFAFLSGQETDEQDAPLVAHQIRLANEFDRTIAQLQVGSATFQGVAPSSTTEYQPIGEGRSSLHGTLEGKGYIYLDTTVVMPPPPWRLWTLVLMADRRFEIRPDTPPPSSLQEPLPESPAPAPVTTFARLRFQNLFRERVYEVRIGDLTYSDIIPGYSTRYFVVPAGTLEVTATVEGFGPGTISEEIYIPEDPYRRYTLRLDEQGTLILLQENGPTGY